MAAILPPLQLTPQTDDRAVAVTWMEDYGRAVVGIEGLVVKGKADPYQPDQRGWVKAKTRETVEALVGAVVGSLDAPRRGVSCSAGTARTASSTWPAPPVSSRRPTARSSPACWSRPRPRTLDPRS